LKPRRKENMKSYLINRHGKENEIGKVTLRSIDPVTGITKEITPEASLKVRNHSPDGFEFGYGGSGPAQLALAILLDFIGKPPSTGCYQAFKFSYISSIGHPGGMIHGDDIMVWLAKYEETEREAK
jgi:hypothetical protein